MKKFVYSAIIPVLIAVVMFTCSKQEEQQSESAAPIDQSAVAVKLTPVVEGDFALPITSSGLITTSTESRLSFKTGGLITRILVKEGETVIKGQLLATLDQTEIDAQVSQTKNNVDKTQRDFDRVQRLYKDSAATMEQFQNAKTAFDVATESFRIAKFNQQYSTIHATTSGKVIRKFVNEGELVSGGSPVLMINSAGENDWIVRLGLPDVDWVRVKRGDKASIATDAYPGENFDATLTLINEAADPVSGLYLAEVKIDPKGRKLASGLVATVTIIPSRRDVMKSIPIEALVEGNGKQAFVFVVNEAKTNVKRIPVEVAYLSGPNAIVAKGLDGVTAVVTAGSAFLTESSTVRVTE